MKYESILESLLYYSPRFRDIINQIDHPVAKELLGSEGKNILPDITFIDIDDKGVVSFSTMNNSIRKISDFLKDTNDSDFSQEWRREDADDIYQYDREGNGPGVYNSSRNEIKIGKLVNKILKSKFKDSDLEKFINLVKSSLEKKQDFSFLSGPDIYWGYSSNNYLSNKGTIGNSCMNDKAYLELYVENKDACRLLVLMEDNKVVGRALV